MNYLGVKVCEFLADEHLIPHLEVDEVNGHKWAQLLAKQENDEANKMATAAESFYAEVHDLRCDRISTTGNGGKCGGRTCIRTLKKTGALFVGCEKFKFLWEKEHLFIPASNYNPTDLIRLWGPERCWVSDEMLADYQSEMSKSEGKTASL